MKTVMIPEAWPDVVGCLGRMMFDTRIKAATIFCGILSDRIKRRVRVTRVRGRECDVTITIGRPNWREREYLKLCKKAKCNPRRWKTWGFGVGIK